MEILEKFWKLCKFHNFYKFFRNKINELQTYWLWEWIWKFNESSNIFKEVLGNSVKIKPLFEPLYEFRLKCPIALDLRSRVLRMREWMNMNPKGYCVPVNHRTRNVELSFSVFFYSWKKKKKNKRTIFHHPTNYALTATPSFILPQEGVKLNRFRKTNRKKIP